MKFGDIEMRETKEKQKETMKDSFERVEKSQRHRTCTLADSAGDEPAKQPLLLLHVMIKM